MDVTAEDIYIIKRDALIDALMDHGVSGKRTLKLIADFEAAVRGNHESKILES